MSGRRSFETINYMLRPNKNVERKLIAKTLGRLQAAFDVRSYRYVGFGSMWFTDFVLMHRVVGISDMVTIEKEASRAKRVEFNKPYACIDVRMEKAATALGDVLEGKHSVTWLDYDGPLKNALSGDLETAVGAMLSGSMILVSVNAMVEQLRGHQLAEGEPILSEVEYLAEICDSQAVKAEEPRLTRNDFPKLVAELLHDRLKAATLSMKPGCEYRPVWTFEYADDATMVTVGGMVADVTDQAKLAECKLDELPFASPEEMFQIELPILTEKEKRALDKLLPSMTAIDAKKLEFELRPAELEAYVRFYLEYPVFNEMAA
jgi:hypothetical protein